MQPDVPPLPPPVNYPAYAPPPPRSGTSIWIWILVAVLGGGCFVVAILAAILFPVFAQARSHARRTSCLSNLKQIAIGNMMYVQDYDERFPIASNWQTDVDPYIKNDSVFHCPEVRFVAEQSTPVPTDYAFNNVLDMMKLKRLADPEITILNYDSTDFSRNATDALTSLPTPGRHLSGNNISFADGHAKFWPDSQPLSKGEILPDTP